MHLLHILTTCAASLAIGYAASLNFRGAESVKVVADRVSVPRRFMVPLGLILSSGAAGLLAGLAVPLLGVAAGAGLVLYFILAVGAHLRVGDRRVGGALIFLLLSAAALVTGVGDHRLGA